MSIEEVNAKVEYETECEAAQRVAEAAVKYRAAEDLAGRDPETYSTAQDELDAAIAAWQT